MKLIILSLLFFSFTAHSKEYLLEVSDFKAINNGQILEEFELLDRKYMLIKSELPPKSSMILSMSENFIIETLESVSAPTTLVDFSKQWGLLNEGKNEPITPIAMSPVTSKKGIDINILPAWALTKGSKQVIIAVLDTGTALNHEELKTNLWINQKEQQGLPGVDDDGNGFIDDLHGYDFTGKGSNTPQDEHGHGTHVAGIIGASHSHGKIAGVMDKVSLMTVRILNKKGRGTLQGALKGFAYAIESGAHIISNSWGHRGYSELLEGLVQEATNRGIIVVAAAGNSRFNNNDLNPTYPANYPGVISVSAVNARGRHSAYSTYGPETVHIAAPGTNILSSHTRRKGFDYRVLSGTSMSAPFVSGVIGLYLSHHGLGQSPEKIKNKLISTAVKLEHLESMNQAEGMINAYRFLTE